MSRAACLAAALAVLLAAPALALAQDDATGDAGSEGARALFKPVPRGEDGAPVEYDAPRRRPIIDSVEAESARLRLLDRMTGLVQTFEMAPGETARRARLEIALRACRVPRVDARADAWAFLEIRDLREAAPRFSGWMFASSPALSALDHQRYDVWVLSCSASAAETSSGSE